MFGPFALPFVQRGLLELLCLSLAAGVLGPWIVARGLAFHAHAVATATFPGLVVAGGLGFPAPLGALAAAGAFSAAVARSTGRRRAAHGTATALVLVGCLALGVVLASDVYHSGSNVDTLLFGSLILIGWNDVTLAAVAALTVAAASFLLGRRWLAVGFDPAGAWALGVRSGAPDALLLAAITLATVAALSAVGALLASALFVLPAASARLLCDRLGRWQASTVALTALEGTAGLWLSVQTDAPPGATIAVVAGAGFVAAAALRALRGRRRLLRIAAAAGAALMLPGCAAGGSGGSRLDVVATTTQVGDFVRQVGGRSVHVHQLLRPNTDPHEYEPRPSDVRAAAEAKVVVESGDKLDHWMGHVLDQAGGNPRVVDLAAVQVTRVPGETTGGEASRYDPHWWHDPVNAEAAVMAIERALGRADPGRRAVFERNAKRYLAKLASLERGIRACMGRVPRDRRKLVTDHDAFNYFARRFGIEVVGAVIPSQTTQAQASAGDVARLVRTIRRERVEAVFPESSINPKLARAIARQTGARANLTLYGDTLGPPGSRGASYLGMEQANADAMVRGFTGGSRGCAIPGIP